MYLLALLSLLGAAFASPISTSLATSDTRDDRAARYVLPRDTIPLFYDVRLFIDPDYVTSFNGSVSIRISPYVATREIVLQAMEMDILRIQVFSERDTTTDLFESYTLATDDTHFLWIQLNTPLVILQPHTIHIDYVSRYATNMFGVYVSTYEYEGSTVNLVTSQLQPTFARRAFPCYDEPSLKAIFRTTIYAPPTYPVVRSNMPERADNLKEDVPGYLKHEFEDTLVMSSYLLAYLVSRFTYVENNVGSDAYHIPFRIYSRPGTQETARFALDFGQRNMAALEEHIEFPYAFPKLDKVAVPDFAAGAMENWGLVIYREVALLVTDGVTPTSTRQGVARIITHENMHMWYGNEVSPLSWTYTWLNEGFANFYESFATELVLPEWRMMDQFVLNMENVFQSDAVLTVNPMTHPVYSPSEIISTFNSVAYQKSGSVIRMTQHFMTPEVFRKSLANYIRTNSRGVVSPSNLYAALQAGLNESNHTIPYTINAVLDRWTNQGGFPVLTVVRSSAAANSLTITQERFLTDRTLTSSDRWHVPINWALSTNPNFNETAPQGWVPPSFPAVSIDIPGLSNAEWYIINKQQTGYYRVNYDERNWAALASVLRTSHETIHLLNRGQILDDSFNLARNGRLNYNYALDISLYLLNEKDYFPWGAVNPSFTYLDTVLSESSAYPFFQEYLRHLSAPLYEELGFNAVSGEEHVAPYHRNIILNLNCRHGNPNCVSRAQELLENFRNNPSQTLNPDIQNVVFCSGLRGGDAENFNFLWNRYLSSSDSSEQSILLGALGCTTNEERRTFYLNQVIDDSSPVREQDRHSIIVGVINSSPDNTNAALDFVVEHFASIQTRVQGLTGTTNILNAFAARLTSQAHDQKVDEFVSRHQSIMTAGETASVAFIRSNIAASITWSNENAATVESWLRRTFDVNSAAALSSSLIVLLSVVAAIFNNY